ncbi:MAG: Uma2 family endonuclease [Planctomycetota bacterium]
MSTAEPKTAIEQPLVTADELLEISSELSMHGKRCELIEGKLIVMSPAQSPHGIIAGETFGLLYNHVRQNKLGKLFAAETGFTVSNRPHTVRAPDVAFVKQERVDALGKIDKFFPEAPTLAVEVVSPSDKAEEVQAKAIMWIESGCEAVWIVWPGDQTVTDYRSLRDIRILTADETLDGGGVVPGFAVKVAEIFAGLS